MSIRGRLRASLAVSLGAILGTAAILTWSALEGSRSRDTEVTVNELQKQISERGILRDEYLLFRDERSKAQWESRTASILALLESAAGKLEGTEERRVAGEMAVLGRQSAVLFGQITRTLAAPGAGPEGLARDVERRDLVSARLLAVFYDLQANASVLVDSAAARTDATDRRSSSIAFIIVAVALGVTLANSVAIGKLVERRVGLLREGAGRLTAGDLTYRLAVSGTDELAEVAHAFDTMASRVQQHVLRLESLNRELEAFSYSVSHDLRAPLRSIDGFARILGEDHGETIGAEGRRCLERIVGAAGSMSLLIDDLLKLSRVSRGELLLEDVDLSDLARTVAANSRPGGPGRTIDVVVADGVRAVCDRGLLRVALEDLFDNAFKFTSRKPQCRVEFGTANDGGERRYFVRDDGAGFDPAYAGKLFGAFQRLHTGVEFPGTGIGLATVQRIVQRHGGRVWAEGRVDHGATFYFTLGEGKP
ncbi:MAG: ATP-binding protein [Acidobacteriota bacterium]